VASNRIIVSPGVFFIEISVDRGLRLRSRNSVERIEFGVPNNMGVQDLNRSFNRIEISFNAVISSIVVNRAGFVVRLFALVKNLVSSGGISVVQNALVIINEVVDSFSRSCLMSRSKKSGSKGLHSLDLHRNTGFSDSARNENNYK